MSDAVALRKARSVISRGSSWSHGFLRERLQPQAFGDEDQKLAAEAAPTGMRAWKLRPAARAPCAARPRKPRSPRACCRTPAERKRVGWGKSGSVRVDLGVRRIIKKKKKK